MRRAATLALVMLAAACAGTSVLLVPLAPSNPPPPVGYLRAGFGTSDITPSLTERPIGLAGYGPDGRRATGVRRPLHARALVLEDAQGERLALVSVDLPIMAMRLHREVANRVAEATGITADRLLISATHTHAGPGGYSDAAYYNSFGSSLSGYDTTLVGFLVTRIAAAVDEAYRDLRRARIGWGVARVWRATWNRSYPAFQRNGARTPWWDEAPPVASDQERAVDPRWLVLRVDAWDPAAAAFRPRGAYSVFAVHGTVVPNINTEIDPDLPGDLARNFERRLNERLATAGGQVPWQAVAPLANGTEGDVTGVSHGAPLCTPPRLRPGARGPGPRAGHGAPVWLEVTRKQARGCIAHALEWSDRQAREMIDTVMKTFDGITLTATAAITLRFHVLPLRGGLAHPLLCDQPLVGVSQPSGSSEDGKSRLYGWRFLGAIGTATGLSRGRLEEGGEAARRPQGCHQEKGRFGGATQPILASLGGVPDVAQITIVRVGDVVLAALPAEITTMAGEQLRDSIRAGLGDGAAAVRHIGITSLTNGYMQYITTAKEYAAQHYEGGSVLYGPGTAAVFAATLRALITATGPSPVPAVRIWP